MLLSHFATAASMSASDFSMRSIKVPPCGTCFDTSNDLLVNVENGNVEWAYHHIQGMQIELGILTCQNEVQK
jgi:hypothetical protein